MSDSDDGVGRGNPPKHSQFKKGQSGNPKGRPKGSQNVVTLLRRALCETVQIQENGKRRRISKAQAIMKQLVNKAATGDARAIVMLFKLINFADEADRAAAEKIASQGKQVLTIEFIDQIVRNYEERERKEKTQDSVI